MVVRTIGVNITGAEDVQRVQSLLNGLKKQVGEVNNLLKKELGAGNKSASFKVNIGFSTAQFQREWSAFKKRVSPTLEVKVKLTGATGNGADPLENMNDGARRFMSNSQSLSSKLNTIGGALDGLSSKTLTLGKALGALAIGKVLGGNLRFSTGIFGSMLKEINTVRNVLQKGFAIGKVVTAPAVKTLTALGNLGRKVGMTFVKHFNSALSSLGRGVIHMNSFQNIFNRIGQTINQGVRSIVQQTKELGDAMVTYETQMASFGQDRSTTEAVAQEISRYGAATAYNGADLLRNTGYFTALGVKDPVKLTKAIAGLVATNKNPIDDFAGVAKQLTDALQAGKLNWQDFRIIQYRQSPVATRLIDEELAKRGYLQDDKGNPVNKQTAIRKGYLSLEKYLEVLTEVGNSDALQSLTNTIKTPKLAWDNLLENIGLKASGAVGAEGPLKGLYDNIVDFIKDITALVEKSDPVWQYVGEKSQKAVAGIRGYFSEWNRAFSEQLKGSLPTFLNGVETGFSGGRVAQGLNEITQALLAMGNATTSQNLGKGLSEVAYQYERLVAKFIGLGQVLLDNGALDTVANFVALYGDMVAKVAGSSVIRNTLVFINFIIDEVEKTVNNGALVSGADRAFAGLLDFYTQLVSLASLFINDTPIVSKGLEYAGQVLTAMATTVSSVKELMNNMLNGGASGNFKKGLELGFQQGVSGYGDDPRGLGRTILFIQKVRKFFEDLMKEYNNLFNTFKYANQVGAEKYGVKIGNFLGEVANIFGKIIEWFDKKIGQLNGRINFNTVKTLVEEVGKMWLSVVNMLTDTVTKSIGSLPKGRLEQGMKNFSSVFQNLQKSLQPIYQELLTGVLKSATGNTGKKLLQAMADFVKAVVTMIRDIIKHIGHGSVEGGLDRILKFFTNILNFMTEIAKFMGQYPGLTTGLIGLVTIFGVIGKVLGAAAGMVSVANTLGLGGLASGAGGGGLLSGLLSKTPITSLLANSEGNALQQFLARAGTPALTNIGTKVGSFGASPLGMIASLVAQMIADPVQNAIGGHAGATVGGALKTAGAGLGLAGATFTGASIGTAIMPGIGTAVGALLGAITNLIMGGGKNLIDGIEGLLTGYNDEYRKQAAENAKSIRENAEAVSRARADEHTTRDVLGSKVTLGGYLQNMTDMQKKVFGRLQQNFTDATAYMQNSMRLLEEAGATDSATMRQTLFDLGYNAQKPLKDMQGTYVRIGEELMSWEQLKAQNGLYGSEGDEILASLLNQVAIAQGRQFTDIVDEQGNLITQMDAYRQGAQNLTEEKRQELQQKLIDAGVSRDQVLQLPDKALQFLVSQYDTYTNTMSAEKKKAEDQEKESKKHGTLKDAWDRLVGALEGVRDWVAGILGGIADWITGSKSGTSKKNYDKGKKKLPSGSGLLFSTGGFVNYLAQGGSPLLGGIFQPRGTDTIPAMLTPGEYVLRKRAVDSLGTNFLDNLNRFGIGALGGNRTTTVVNNYYNNNASVNQNIDNKSNYLNGMYGLDRLMRYV
jgi:hypothetical protein